MKISVAICCGSEPNNLRVALESIAQQGDPTVKCSIVDLGSSESVQSLTQQYANFIESYQGVSSDLTLGTALKIALAAAQGDIVTWLLPNESYQPNALSSAKGCFDNNPKLDLVGSASQYVDEAGRPLPYLLPNSVPITGRNNQKLAIPFPHTVIFVTRAGILKCGPIDETSNWALGLEHWLRAQDQVRVISVLSESLTQLRVGGTGAAAQMPTQLLIDSQKVLARHNYSAQPLVAQGLASQWSIQVQEFNSTRSRALGVLAGAERLPESLISTRPLAYRNFDRAFPRFWADALYESLYHIDLQAVTQLLPHAIRSQPNLLHNRGFYKLFGYTLLRQLRGQWLGSLPNFIIIGTQRGGTTSLYQYLTAHPHMAAAKDKEIRFFDVEYRKGLGWYRTRFTTKQQQRDFKRQFGFELITGEASPDYLYHPHVARRISKALPQVKLIVMLRDPVERAYSNYFHERKLGTETLSFEEAIRQEPVRLAGETEHMLRDENYLSYNRQHYSYLARGLYLNQLADWLSLFGRDQLLILGSEDFYADPEPALKQVTDFLGLTTWKPDNFERHNYSANNNPIPDSVQARLKDYFRPHNQQLFDRLNRDFGWNKK